MFHTEPATSAVGLDVESQVTIAVDGMETTFPLRSTGDTILDAAMQQGIDPPYSCAGGACGTCRAKVLLGQAVMDQNHVLERRGDRHRLRPHLPGAPGQRRAPDRLRRLSGDAPWWRRLDPDALLSSRPR